ncbi:hypothetical protein T484DRAFT_1974645 [Baffinella frigidus]|nr:hypothetical protein T484DRAFT_1974645 [Cryptophyta sp. CCMP2293]
MRQSRRITSRGTSSHRNRSWSAKRTPPRPCTQGLPTSLTRHSPPPRTIHVQ